MEFLKSKWSWTAAPILWFASVVLLTVVWALSPATPEWIAKWFDNDGVSFVESITIGFFFLQLLCIWFVPPMPAGRRLRRVWQFDFSLITLIAVCREMDWHKAWVHCSNLPGATVGTPYKMRFLTNANNPLGDRLFVLAVFAVVIACCGITLLRFLPKLWKGLFKLHPVCWSIAFLGGTTILVQFVDRFPSIARKKLHIALPDSTRALFSILEEGQEMLLPLFVILALLQAYFIYVEKTPALEKHRW